MKWIVYWVLTGWMETPCPDNVAGCFALHGKVYAENHSQTFTDSLQANTFYLQKKNECNKCLNGIKDVEIKKIP